jgi:hypothetical protein
MRRFIGMVAIFLLMGQIACTAKKSQLQFGMGDGKSGYVPARIAVLSCRPWPEEARFDGLTLSNTDKQATAAVCADLDKFVLEGFRDQPYMKGFTPAAVAKLLATAPNGATTMEQFDVNWHHLSSDCHQCENFPSFYHHSIEPRNDWRKWLNSLSQLARNSDAVLIPFVLYTQQAKINDRGMLRSSISSGVGLMLLDTNNGAVLWSNERQSEYAASILESSSSGNFPEFPKWTSLTERLLVESLWKDFPGRLIL